MAINKPQFAKECVDATVYCGVFSYLHYLIAVAQLRSEISDSNNGEEIGPFRLLQRDWDAYRSDSDFDFNFLSTDINIWQMQCHVAALMVYRAEQRLANSRGQNPNALQLYLEQWPQTPQEGLAAALAKALSDTESLLAPAAKAFFGQSIPVIELADADAPPPPASAATGNINFGKVPNGKRGAALAQQILSDFKNAGFGFNQQVAALANAIAESKLNPNAHAARGEDSFGLFQLNRLGGLGTGHSPAELIDPETNIQIVVQAALHSKTFVRASTLEDAVSAFVKDVERPKDIAGQTTARIGTARQLIA